MLISWNEFDLASMCGIWFIFVNVFMWIGFNLYVDIESEFWYSDGLHTTELGLFYFLFSFWPYYYGIMIVVVFEFWFGSNYEWLFLYSFLRFSTGTIYFGFVLITILQSSGTLIVEFCSRENWCFGSFGLLSWCSKRLCFKTFRRFDVFWTLFRFG